MNIRAERPEDIGEIARVIWRRAILCIVLGVVTTVALAWALAVVPLPHFLLQPDTPLVAPTLRYAIDGDGSFGVVSRSERLGFIGLEQFFGDASIGMSPSQAALFAELVPAAFESEFVRAMDAASKGDRGRAIIITGLPWPCLWASLDLQPSSGYWWFRAGNGIVVRPAPAAPSSPEPLDLRERVIPLRVWWAPFAADIALWSIAWGVLLDGPGMIRRVWRRHRGRCPHCGHSRIGLDSTSPCPECGRMHRRRNRMDAAVASAASTNRA